MGALQWGTHGTGGSGSWDSTTADWYDGTSNLAWTPGQEAIFGGTGGTVTLGNSQTTSELLFNSPGYTLTGSFNIDGVNSALTIDTESDATINTSLGSSGTTLTKTGDGTLTVAGSQFLFGQVAIQEGDLVVDPTAYSNTVGYSLANTAGATLTLDGSRRYFANGISGGGTTGGLVQAGTASMALSLVNTGIDTFGGVLADNGAAQLSLFMVGPGREILTGVNTYSGATDISGGSLFLSGAGSISNSSLLILQTGGVLLFDDLGTNVTNRVSSSAQIQLNGGVIFLNGNNSAASSETMGQLDMLTGSTQILSVAGTGQTATLTFASIMHSDGTIDFDGPGTIHLTTGSNTNGILGGYATYNGADWATLDSSNNVVAYTAYASNSTSSGATSNVKIEATGGNISYLPTSEINSLKVDVSSASTLVLSSQMALQSGGLLVTGTSALTITGGSISAGVAESGEIYINNSDTLTLDSQIVTSGSFFKTGTGNLIFAGPLSNPVASATVAQGSLTVASGAVFNSGSLNVDSGASLQVDGQVAGNTIFNGTLLNGIGKLQNLNMEAGTLAVGDNLATTGKLTTGSLWFQSTLALRLDPFTLSSDLVSVSGNVTLLASTLSLSILGGDEVLAQGTQFDLIDYTGTLTGSGNFMINGVAIADGGTFSLGDNTYELQYAGGTVEDSTVDLVVVSEPSTWTLLTSGICSLGFCCVRRRATSRVQVAI